MKPVENIKYNPAKEETRRIAKILIKDRLHLQEQLLRQQSTTG
jgi:hypothetical protein